MSRIIRSPGLTRAGVVLLTALWLVPVEIPILKALPYPVRPAAAQDFPPQEPGGQDPLQPQDDPDAMPRPGRSKKAARKKARLAEKGATPKADLKTKAKEKKDATAETKSAGSGRLKFSQDIAPILVAANCVRCHSPGGVGLRRGKLDLTTFEKLQKGTPEHKVMVAGNPDESHLVMRIKGEETPRMPQGGQTNLSEKAIAAIAQWVKEGARLDAGIDPKATLESYASTPEQLRQKELAKMAPSDRDQKIEAEGRQRWKQTNPKLKPEIVPGKQFILFSNLPKDRAASMVKAMETQYLRLKRSFGLPATDWVEKVSLYVFNSKNDFVEFVRTVEGRDVEPEEQSTAKLAIPQPYIAALDPAGGNKEEAAPRRRARGKRSEEGAGAGAERSLLGLLTEALGSGVVGAAGNPPRWLRLGIGTYMASAAEPRSPYYRQLRITAFQNVNQGWQTKASQAMGGGEQLTAADLRAISFALVECMMTSELSRGFPAFLHGMLEGQEKLDDMLKQVYGADREGFLTDSGEWVAARYGNDE